MRYLYLFIIHVPSVLFCPLFCTVWHQRSRTSGCRVGVAAACPEGEIRHVCTKSESENTRTSCETS